MTVSSKGQIVIPREVREKLNITKGTKLEVIEMNGEIILIRLPDDPLKSLRGMFKAKRPIQEMRRWVKEEDRKLAERRPSRS
jgi:AbrB family looped-hinge helix DNA binding protein